MRRMYEVNVELMKVCLVRFICAVNTGLNECVSFIQQNNSSSQRGELLPGANLSGN